MEKFESFPLKIGSMWQSAICFTMIALAGMLRKEEWAVVGIYFAFGSWVVVHAARAQYYVSVSEWSGVALYCALCLMQLGNLILAVLDRWLLLAFWYGGCSVTTRSKYPNWCTLLTT